MSSSIHTPLSTCIPVYPDDPRDHQPSHFFRHPMLFGSLLFVSGLALLAASWVAATPSSLHVTAGTPQLAISARQTWRHGKLAAGPDAEEELTVGDLLRGGSSKKTGVSAATASIAQKIRMELEEEASGAPKEVIPSPDAQLLPPSPWQGAQGTVVDEEKGITRISFGVIGLVSGLALLAYGFGAYFQILPGESASAVMLIYGFPASLIGFALKYAELQPLVCRSTPEALALRESKATDIQRQVREDVTRFRYGDEKHLEEAINRIFQLGRPDGIPRNAAPTLIGIQEQVIDGEYTLVMEFENNPRVELKQWINRQPKFESFFGPGIRVKLGKTEKGVDVALICDGTGAGRGGKGQDDVLPPLMPGLPARRQS